MLVVTKLLDFCLQHEQFSIILRHLIVYQMGEEAQWEVTQWPTGGTQAKNNA